jgi:phenylacetate-CoA ligase
MQLTRTNVADIIWPGIPSAQSSVLMGILLQMGQSEWLPSETLVNLQFQQINQLIHHARRTVPYYRDSFVKAGITEGQPLSTESWPAVPILSRNDLLEHREDLLSNALPRAHGTKLQRKTSGSSGRGLEITDSQLRQIFYHCNTLRFSLWQKRDLLRGYLAIRSGRFAENPLEVTEGATWGPPHSLVYITGPSTTIYHRMPIEQQAEILMKKNPGYLLAYPSNVTRLAHYFKEQGLGLPGLKLVTTYGETVLPETATACKETWGVDVADMYSSEEAGYIAVQCPQSDNYHCMSESILVEVLDENGKACQPGEIGKVVLTVLHNFAMPLIRYENLDYAEVGPPCECGRGLAVIKRIVGRKRNMARALDGGRFWPDLDSSIWSDNVYCNGLQLVQDKHDHITLRIEAEKPLGPEREDSLTKALGTALGQPYRFSVRYQQETLRHANGKYERFICQV